MLQILSAYGIPKKILTAIEVMYNETLAKVISPDGSTELFKIMKGVLQGDTLAPYLFVIVLDYALRKAIIGREEELGFLLESRRSRRYQAKCLTDLEFADDIMLASNEISQAQELLSCVERFSYEIGLELNVKKTKCMLFNNAKNSSQKLYTNGGKEIEIVDDFRYLGSYIESSEKDISIRKALAWQAIHKMRKIWYSKMNRDLKIRLFKSTVESVLLYGCEAWTITSKIAKSLNGTYTRLLRTVLNIRVDANHHISNVNLYQDLPYVSDIVRWRRLKLAGHCHRAKKEIVSQLLFWHPRHGSSKRGRPLKSYVDVLLEDTGLYNQEEIKSLMNNREEWKELIARDRKLARQK